jgi:hypothetical protein
MKLAIMQPYFLPYLGYFSLIKNTEEFILLDSVQFIRHGWIERNRILKPSEGCQYIHVPLQKHSRETLIKDIIINNSTEWKKKILSQLEHYKTASYYKTVASLLSDIFADEYTSIVDLNFRTLKTVCDYLGKKASIKVFSNMNLTIEKATAPDEWALNICKALGNTDEYWNPPGGITLFDKSKYELNKIGLRFQKINLSEYKQKGGAFEAGLSIIDVMMFNSPVEISKMLDNYELI